MAGRESAQEHLDTGRPAYDGSATNSILAGNRQARLKTYLDPTPTPDIFDTGALPNPEVDAYLEKTWEKERVHASDLPTGFPYVYVNGEDVTVTVDPVKNQAWVRDDGHNRYALTRLRGQIKDHKGVKAVRHLVDTGQFNAWQAALPRLVQPTSQELDSSLKLSARCISNSTRGRVGKGPRSGQLPIISQMIWKNQFVDVPDWLCEAGTWNEYRRPNRAFDCGGACR